MGAVSKCTLHIQYIMLQVHIYTNSVYVYAMHTLTLVYKLNAGVHCVYDGYSGYTIILQVRIYKLNVSVHFVTTITIIIVTFI